MRPAAGVLAVALALLHAAPAAASANTKAKGRGVIIPSLNYYYVESRFGPSLGFSGTDYSANGRFWKLGQSLWVEYGITDDLNFIADGDYASNHFENDFGVQENSGFGDPQVGLKYRFWNPALGSDTMWAVQTRVQLPVEEEGKPATGYHEYEVEQTLIATRDVRWFDRKVSLSGELGYRWRDGGAADVVELKYGFNTMFGPSTMLLSSLDGDVSVGNQDRTLADINPSLAPDYDRFTLKVGISRRLAKNLWVNPSLARDVAGRNAGVGNEIKLGFWVTF